MSDHHVIMQIKINEFNAILDILEVRTQTLIQEIIVINLKLRMVQLIHLFIIILMFQTRIKPDIS